MHKKKKKTYVRPLCVHALFIKSKRPCKTWARRKWKVGVGLWCTIYRPFFSRQWHSCLLNFAWRACSAFTPLPAGRNWVTINGTIVEVTGCFSSSQASGDRLEGKRESRSWNSSPHCFWVGETEPWQPSALTHTYSGGPGDKVPLVLSFILCLQNNKGVHVEDSGRCAAASKASFRVAVYRSPSCLLFVLPYAPLHTRQKAATVSEQVLPRRNIQFF